MDKGYISFMMKSNSEILSIIDLLSEEKGISKGIVVNAIEDAFSKLAAGYYGNDEGEVIAKMNLKNGDILFYQKKVVKPRATMLYEISLQDAKGINPDAEIDGYVLCELPSIPMERALIYSIRGNILEKIRGAEKEIEYNEFKKREGENVVGVVKKISSVNAIVGLRNDTEAIVFRDGMMKTDNYRVGDKIKAYLKEVRRSDYDCQIILSRTDNNFLAMLLAENVPEVQDGIIEIKSIARDCGFKSKVAVISADGNVDAVGSCVGARGSRIKPVIDELKGERVDVVCWDRDLVLFAKNAITPAKALYGEFSDITNSIELVVPDDQLKLAIGKGGQNVRLASQLVGCNITVIPESEKKKAVQERFANNVSLMSTALDLDNSVAEFLVSSNIITPMDLINVGVEKLIKSGVFTEDIAQELVNRADNYIKEQQAGISEELSKLGVDKDILSLEGMNLEMALSLGKNGIKTVKDIADLSTDEFIEYCGAKEDCIDNANRAIMNARKLSYNIE